MKNLLSAQLITHFIRFVKDSVQLIQQMMTHLVSNTRIITQQTQIYKITKRFSYPQSQNQTVYPKSNNRAKHAMEIAILTHFVVFVLFKIFKARFEIIHQDKQLGN
ncbi:Hypothetical_protein [Hexamita inflata]|uniref:Hypothetical_protein n=1 Tax=Hexamita inflata TaxID=28002 RepID=A0ABP1JRW9_9EUKA